MHVAVILNPKTDLYMDIDGNWVDSIANAFEFLSAQQAEAYLRHLGIHDPDNWIITYGGKPRER